MQQEGCCTNKNPRQRLGFSTIQKPRFYFKKKNVQKKLFTIEKNIGDFNKGNGKQVGFFRRGEGNFNDYMLKVSNSCAWMTAYHLGTT